jgi:hypothetical protein
VKDGIRVQLALTRPQVVEGDTLGMAQEPRGLVVERRPPFVEPADPEQYAQADAMGTQVRARRRGPAGLDSG